MDPAAEILQLYKESFPELEADESFSQFMGDFARSHTVAFGDAARIVQGSTSEYVVYVDSFYDSVHESLALYSSAAAGKRKHVRKVHQGQTQADVLVQSGLVIPWPAMTLSSRVLVSPGSQAAESTGAQIYEYPASLRTTPASILNISRLASELMGLARDSNNDGGEVRTSQTGDYRPLIDEARHKLSTCLTDNFSGYRLLFVPEGFQSKLERARMRAPRDSHHGELPVISIDAENIPGEISRARGSSYTGRESYESLGDYQPAVSEPDIDLVDPENVRRSGGSMGSAGMGNAQYDEGDEPEHDAGQVLRGSSTDLRRSVRFSEDVSQSSDRRTGTVDQGTSSHKIVREKVKAFRKLDPHSKSDNGSKSRSSQKASSKSMNGPKNSKLEFPLWKGSRFPSASVLYEQCSQDPRLSGLVLEEAFLASCVYEPVNAKTGQTITLPGFMHESWINSRLEKLLRLPEADTSRENSHAKSSRERAIGEKSVDSSGDASMDSYVDDCDWSEEPTADDSQSIGQTSASQESATAELSQQILPTEQLIQKRKIIVPQNWASRANTGPRPAFDLSRYQTTLVNLLATTEPRESYSTSGVTKAEDLPDSSQPKVDFIDLLHDAPSWEKARRFMTLLTLINSGTVDVGQTSDENSGTNLNLPGRESTNRSSSIPVALHCGHSLAPLQAMPVE